MLTRGRVGADYYRLTLLTDHARPRREQLFRDYPSRAICGLLAEGDGIGRAERVARLEIASTASDHPATTSTCAARSTCGGSSTRDLYACVRVCVFG